MTTDTTPTSTTTTTPRRSQPVRPDTPEWTALLEQLEKGFYFPCASGKGGQRAFRDDVAKLLHHGTLRSRLSVVPDAVQSRGLKL